METNSYQVFANGNLVAANVRSALSFVQRLRGLIGSRPLRQGVGLLLDPGGSVHTFGMSYPIDVVFLSHNDKVLATRSAMSPNRLCFAPRQTRRTLELRAGSCEANELTPGCRLYFEAKVDA